MVDIIIRAKDGHALTRSCLRSVLDNTPTVLGDDGDYHLNYRTILISDGDKSQFMGLEPEFSDPAIHVNCLEGPNGAVTATNLGLAVSLQFTDSDYVMVMDNDTQVPEGDSTWLERMVKELEADPKCAAVGATTSKANPPQHILTVPQTYTADWQDEEGKKGGTKNNPDVPWFVSFCVLLRKSAVREVGFWDERYNPGNYEDTDYAMQLRRAGYTVRVARSVYIHHVGHQTFSDDLHRLLRENKMKFIEKWGPGALADAGMIGADEAVGFYKAAGLVP